LPRIFFTAPPAGEYVQTLLETFPLVEVSQAIDEALTGNEFVGSGSNWTKALCLEEYCEHSLSMWQNVGMAFAGRLYDRLGMLLRLGMYPACRG
jgi:hypothetical protein